MRIILLCLTDTCLVRCTVSYRTVWSMDDIIDLLQRSLGILISVSLENCRIGTLLRPSKILRDLGSGIRVADIYSMCFLAHPLCDPLLPHRLTAALIFVGGIGRELNTGSRTLVIYGWKVSMYPKCSCLHRKDDEAVESLIDLAFHRQKICSTIGLLQHPLQGGED